MGSDTGVAAMLAMGGGRTGPSVGGVRREVVAGGETGGVGGPNAEVEATGRSPGSTVVAGEGEPATARRRVSSAVEGRGVGHLG